MGSQPFHAGHKLVEFLLGLLILREGVLYADNVRGERELIDFTYFVFLLPSISFLLQGMHLTFEMLGLQIHLTEPG